MRIPLESYKTKFRIDGTLKEEKWIIRASRYLRIEMSLLVEFSFRPSPM
jgi:hypothetical protein